jgi:hypothetical protein
MTALLEFWYAILAIFSTFDPIAYAIMAIIIVGAGLMMPNITSLITATVAALMIFALALFARTALSAKDAASLARSDWNDFLALPLHTLFVYASVFAVAITIIHAIRSLVKR